MVKKEKELKKAKKKDCLKIGDKYYLITNIQKILEDRIEQMLVEDEISE